MLPATKLQHKLQTKPTKASSCGQINYATPLSNNPFQTMQSSPTLLAATQTRLYTLIAQYWLPLGYFLLLTGMIWLPELSTHTKLYYGFFAFPALLGLIVKPCLFKTLLREPIIVFFLLLAALMILSLDWSQEHSPASLTKRPLYIFMLFAGCAIMACRDVKLLLTTLRISAVVMSLGAAYNLIQFLPSATADARLVGTGTLRNPLLSSHVFGFFCAYWLATWATSQSRNSWIAILLALPLLAVVLETGSRTPLLAIFAVALWLMMITGKKGLYVFAAVCLAAVALYFVAPDILMERGLSYRPQIWQQALEQAQEKLWFGYGYQSEFIFTIPGMQQLEDPHNVELAVLLHLGLVGLIIWAAMYFALLRKTLQLRHDAAIQVASALVCYGVFAGLTEGSSFISRPNENWYLIWIPLALFAALSIRQRVQNDT